MGILRLFWRFSLVVTLPVSILFILWISYTFNLYKADHLHFGVTEQDTVLLDSGKLNFVYMLDFLREATIGSDTKADFNIFIGNKALKHLNSDLPYSGLGGENFQPAHMQYPDGELERIQIRYRGDLTNHWLLREKSYRIKTRKKRLLGNMRRFNLIVNETQDLLGPHMAYRLADLMNLLAPKSEFVTLSINGKADGARLFVEQIDESFLRRRGIMPGDIYSGDNAGNGKFRGIERSLFKSGLNWDKAAANNHYDLASKVPLRTMLAELRSGRFHFLNLTQFGTYAAYIDLLRSKHHDETHNWKLHYDHYMERFAPIVWDSTGWLPSLVAQDNRGGIASSTLMRTLYKNHDFLYERQKALINFYTSLQADFYALLETEIETVERKTKGIPYFVDALKDVRTRKKTLEAVSDFRHTVHSVLQEVKEATVGGPGSYSYSRIDEGIRLALSGNPVSQIRIALEPGVEPSAVTIRYKADGELVEQDITPLSDLDSNRLEINLRLFPTSDFVLDNHTFGTATFDLLLGSLSPAAIESVQVTPLTLDSQQVQVELVDYIAQIEFKGEFGIIPPIANPAPLILSGTQFIDDFRVIERDLVIEPGTKLVLSEGAGLKILGKLTAVGTQNAPILFTAKNPDTPWGAIAIKDHAANGSQFEHCLFENGSGVKDDVFEYTAMLSIHNVDNVLIKNSLFRDSKVTDDMLHVVYSELTIENSVFERARSDAVDLDITAAKIIGSRFIDSGNDAIDLMTSRALISGSEMKNSGDKGASIGENSLLFTVNSKFLGNHIGMESKDSSQALIFNSLIKGNVIGAHAYQKNWQYGNGGNLTIANSVFEDNLELSRVGKKSAITIFDSYIDSPRELERGTLLSGTDSRLKNQAQGEAIPNPEDLPEFLANYLPLADRDIRGVFEHSD